MAKNKCTNELLYGLPEHLILKLQRVQNAGARLITNSPKHCHITPILHQLHWLPVRFRCIFKILCIVFRCLNGLGPKYLTEYLHFYQPTRVLRSSLDNLLLVIPRSCRKYGDRAFSVAAPRLWNSLPYEIRAASSFYIFKKCLKTHLFIQAFT